MKCVAFAVAVLMAAVGMGETEPRPSVVFLGAHPDDSEGFAGLAFLLARNYDVYVVDLTRGERGLGEAGWLDGTTAMRRLAEEKAACARLGATLHFLCEIDGEACASYKSADRLAAILRETKPIAVFTHWPVDTHHDHVQCAAVMARALKMAQQKPERYFFEVLMCQTQNWHPLYSVDISTTLADKLAMLRDYACQNVNDHLAQVKKAQAEQRGRERVPPCAAAETFTTYDGRPIANGVLEKLREAVRIEGGQPCERKP